jgi:hypothetical protein
MAVHNNRQNKTTGLSPNQILLGYELTLHPEEGAPSNNEAMETRVQNTMRKREQAIDAINQTTRTKQTLTSQYKLRDQVWLEATHLKICH